MDGKVGWRNHTAAALKPSWGLFCKAVSVCLAVCLLTSLAQAILLPEASGTDVYEKGGATIDASHSDQGYIMVKRQSKKAQKMRITLGKNTMTYDLNSNGEYEVFPLQLGDGKYKVEIFEQASGSKYSTAASVKFSAKLADATLPYLYPNQYVQYDAATYAVQKGEEVCKDAKTDAEKVEAVYRYICENLTYDYIFAMEVGQGKWKGYIPSVDNTLAKQTGVCFDFSALMACMLRSQGVATQLVIGNADKVYHAWNNIQVDGKWYQYDVTTAICQGKVSKYTPERVY